jgi:hypothetical protein
LFVDEQPTIEHTHRLPLAPLREHLAAFLNAYNFARRLKTLASLTSYQFICCCRQKERGRFKPNPHCIALGLNIQPVVSPAIL